jgi:ligand-binding SRPBCC domain-containing protein
VSTHTLQTETVLNAPLEKVFEFFSNAENLGRITPDDLGFEILTPTPIEMKQGALIDYRIKLGMIPMLWRTEITVWEPNTRFVDSQLKGPYKKWIHEHRFVAEGDKTRMFDRVDYEVPGFFLSPLIAKLFVSPRVNRIFRHRNQVINDLF